MSLFRILRDLCCAGGVFCLAVPAQAQLDDQVIRRLVLADLLEYQPSDDAQVLRWDAFAWVGRDYDKLWIKTEGEQRTDVSREGILEAQVLYARLLSPFWFLQAGLRHDRLTEPVDDRSRSFVVLGVQGLAPYRFDTETALFVSEEGDVSWRLTASYDFWLTQRMALQPRVDTNVAAQDVPDFGTGGGVNDIELGLRLRYEVMRKFAPYVGMSWKRRFGETADLARQTGEDIGTTTAVVGVRLWF